MLVISPTAAPIKHYYEELAQYQAQGVTHELAVKTAFQNVLAGLAPTVGWTLIPEQTLPDGMREYGTLRRRIPLPRGYWEAKDTKDDLNSEIRKKTAAGYPTVNTIFEDTRRAVLYQDRKPVLERPTSRNLRRWQICSRPSSGTANQL